MLFRAPRVQKAFKVVRMLRLVKLIKLAKNNENLKKANHENLKIQSGAERLALLLGIIAYIIHFCSCFWLIIGTIDDLNAKNSWLVKYRDES